MDSSVIKPKHTLAEHPQQERLWLETLKNLLRNRSAIAGMVIIGILVALAFLAPYISPFEPLQQMIGYPGESGRLSGKPPCINNDLPFFAVDCQGLTHIMGLDLNTRDMLSRILHGAKTSLLVGVFAVLIALSCGTTLGLIAGYGGSVQNTNEHVRIRDSNLPIKGLWRVLWCIIVPPIGVWDRGNLAKWSIIGILGGGLIAGVVQLVVSFTDAQLAVNLAYIDAILTVLVLMFIVGWILAAVAALLINYPEDIIMRVMDVMLAFPSLILAIAIVTIRGPGLENALFGIAIVSIPAYARLSRASVLAVKEMEFVTAAQALGASPLRIIFRQILPNSLTPIIVQGTLGIGTAILDAAALSFLGLGAQPPEPEWGQMLSEARNRVFTQPHLVFFPGLAIMISVLGFNLLGDGMRDALDPRLNRI